MPTCCRCEHDKLLHVVAIFVQEGEHPRKHCIHDGGMLDDPQTLTTDAQVY